jgi:hypothetical protein
VRRLSVPAVLWLAVLAAPPAQAVELQLKFGALERMLADSVFTQEGRRYVHGNKGNKCNFAYLEKPRIQSDAAGLRIRALFTGRSALNIAGQCVGMGDAFTVLITATPAYKDGNIVLQNVIVTGDGKTGFYIRRVCTVMAASLSHDFKYPIAATAQKILEDPVNLPTYKREVRNFRVPAIRVAEDALVIELDFELTVH